MFYNQDDVTESKHAEAVGEGAQDFEYIQMLRQKRPELRHDVDRKLEEVLRAENTSKRLWNVPKDRTLTEKARREFLEMMARRPGKDP